MCVCVSPIPAHSPDSQLAKLKTAEAKNPNSGGVEFGSSPRLPSTAISPPAPSPLGVTLGAASPLLSLSASELAAELASIAYGALCVCALCGYVGGCVHCVCVSA